MSQAYSNPKREDDPYSLPNVEVFYVEAEDIRMDDGDSITEPGWYWWPCLPGCLPDGDPIGPFSSEAEVIADAQDGVDDE
ncbi:MAG: hypothetical protein WC763_07295 [Candidatus Paceibacterota bacterium]|jgi:hypothetical protein